jgi:hypothetical protein
MNQRHRYRASALVLTMGLAAAACGSDSATSTADSGSTTTAATSATTATTGATTAGTEGDVMALPDLASVCPATVVVQTDWFPESEHGALYHLLGDDYQIDANQKRVSGTMTLDGKDLGVDIEIRAGGPAIGSGNVAAEMYVDDSITIGYGSTDGQILRFEKTPLLSVAAPLELNPQIIYWDPETYPEIKTLADLGTKGVTINVFAGGTFADVFVAQGIWKQDQIDPSYDGSPSRFVSQRNIAQQGFASAEPWIYKNQVTEYGRDLAFQLLNDAGFPVYSQTLAIRPAEIDKLRPCLEELVPVFQRSTVDFYANPKQTNAKIVATVKAYDTFWTYPAELADFSVATQLELKLASNGADKTVGNMDEKRVQEVIDALTKAKMEFPATMKPSDLVTNEFIDPSIGF